MASAGFAPVKGTRHRARDRIALDGQGPVGDRAWCLVDPDRGVVLRTVEHPSLIAVVAEQEGDVLSLTLPTGESVAAAPERSGESVVCSYWGRAVEVSLSEGPHADLLSTWLGRPVRLGAAPRGGVVFGASVTVVGTASLESLAELAGRPALVSEAARFRATLVVETDEPHVEETWLGESPTVGGARLRIAGPIPRCAVVDRHPETGERDGAVLKTLARHRPRNAAGEPMFGVYAEVVQPGVVTLG